MSDRERWIVYPLLLLTLGVVMRDKLTRTVETDQIICHKILAAEHIKCRDIELVGSNDKPMMLVGGAYKGQNEWVPGPVISIIGPDDRTRAHLGEAVQCREVVAAGVVQANGLRAVSRVNQKKQIAAGTIRVPLVIFTDLKGTALAKIDGNGFQRLPITPPGSAEAKPQPNQQGPKQNQDPPKQSPEEGPSPESAKEG